MQPDVPESIAGVDDKLLAAVTLTLPELPNLMADVGDRFAREVRALVETRAQAKWPGEATNQDVAAFVFVDRPREVGDRLGAAPIANPIATNDPLLGRLFLMNRDATSGRVRKLPVKPNDLIEWLADNGLGGRPIVMVYRKTKTMVTRRDGVDGFAQHDPIRSQKPNATVAELLDALAYFHNRQLTPITCVEGIWEPERAIGYVPGPFPEKTIQSEIQIALNYWFRGVIKAETEDKTPIGRIDVRLLRKSKEGPLAYWAIVELKVIKSYANAPKGQKPSTVGPADNISAIVKGLTQAYSYRENRDAEEGLLEVFDLRKDKNQNLFDAPEVTAVLCKFSPIPQYTVRPLFGSSDDARKAGYTGV